MELNYSFLEQNFKQTLDLDIPLKKLKDKKILITGANGLIASTFIDYLMYLNQKFGLSLKIFALSRSLEKTMKRFNRYGKDINFIVQDVITPLKIDDRINYIIHAASNAHPVAYSNDPVGTIKGNLLGTFNMCDFGIKIQAERIMFISSSEVYGEKTDKENKRDETSFGYIDPLNFRSCYSEGKRASETIFASYKKQFGLDFVVIRTGHIYGPAITNNNSRADSQFLRKVINNESIIMKSKGEQLRSYCYVIDAVTAMLIVLLKGKSGEAYNIANPNTNVSIKTYAETLANNANVNLKFELPDNLEKAGYSKISNAIINPNKLIRLGWEPKFNLQDGLDNTLKILERGDINEKSDHLRNI